MSLKVKTLKLITFKKQIKLKDLKGSEIWATEKFAFKENQGKQTFPF